MSGFFLARVSGMGRESAVERRTVDILGMWRQVSRERGW